MKINFGVGVPTKNESNEICSITHTILMKIDEIRLLKALMDMLLLFVNVINIFEEHLC